MSVGTEGATTSGSDHGAALKSSERGVPALLTSLERGRRQASLAGEGEAATGVPKWVQGLLRIPLSMKLAGANAFLLIAATITAIVVRNHELTAAPVLIVVGAAFLVALLVNIVLVNLAVRPMTILEKTVDTIWHGDFDARVPPSLLADRHVARVGRMFNSLLDGLLADRARARRLAAELISAGDRERAAVSRELHDSTAQSLAALVMQLGALAHNVDATPVEKLKERLDNARTLAAATLEEVRLMAHTMHPRVLDDLGLVAAVRRLVRESIAHASSPDGTTAEVVAVEGIDEDIPAAQASVLYRVAQEALQNVLRHAAASNVEIHIWVDDDTARIEIADDGVGFDPDAPRPERVGIGLFAMRERVALMDGDLHISSSAGAGTSVVASVPLHSATTFLQPTK
jgi:signal transduction histidine kinase